MTSAEAQALAERPRQKRKRKVTDPVAIRFFRVWDFAVKPNPSMGIYGEFRSIKGEVYLNESKTEKAILSARYLCGGIHCTLTLECGEFVLKSYYIRNNSNPNNDVTDQWLPLFRRNCYLSGAAIECSAHERLCWIQELGLSEEECRKWQLL